MKDSKGYFHPETIRRISKLELRAKYIVEGLLSGMHRSAFFGQSIEFRQHRDYVQGDDPRHVDWKLWARQDKLYVKQYEEETHLNCHLLVDVSESMFYGSGDWTKLDYAATLACCLAHLVIRQKDFVSCSLFDSQIVSEVAPGNSNKQLETIARLFPQGPAGNKTSIKDVVIDYANQLRKKSLIVLISDFFDDVDEILKGLLALRQFGHEVLLIHVVDKDEAEFPFQAPTHFEGLESDLEFRCNPSAFRDSYLQAFSDFRHEITKCCSTAAADYEFCTTEHPFNAVLSRLLNRRTSKQRR